MDQDEALDELILKRAPVLDAIDTASTALVIFAFPVLAGGIVAIYLGYLTFRSAAAAYFIMTLAGVFGKFAAPFIRRQIYLRRAQMIGTPRDEAAAYWRAFDQNEAAAQRDGAPHSGMVQ